MTLFDLVIRSMRKNIKHYYLYFFALIFSVALYFVFATLQYDGAVVEGQDLSSKMTSAFQVANILLIFISGIFIIYANAIFLKRRNKEIGLYQLIGLTKSGVTRLLIVENLLLNVLALVIGVVTGLIASRLFLVLLMELIGMEGVIQLSFSIPALLQTMKVFLLLIAITSIQMIVLVRRRTLISLFQGERSGDSVTKPAGLGSFILGVLGIAFITFGYWLSQNMLNAFLLLNMILVLFSTIFGTYLVFRVTIRWIFYLIRQQKNGHLGVRNSLSLAPLMHRMKGNANSLTIITVLSAMTLTMITVAYSLFYTTGESVRMNLPYDKMFDYLQENEEPYWERVKDGLDEQNIAYTTHYFEGIHYTGEMQDGGQQNWFVGRQDYEVLAQSDVEKAGLLLPRKLKEGEVYFYDMSVAWAFQKMKNPIPIQLTDLPEQPIQVIEVPAGNAVNLPVSHYRSQLVVTDALYEVIKQRVTSDELLGLRSVMLHNKKDLPLLDELAKREDRNAFTYGAFYKEQLQNNGLLIFISGFLGLVFLISTGSILYFKQMTEAEQERQSYHTLRQLGFDQKELMAGIIRKQLFVFGIPLLIGICHAIFAVKSAAFLFPVHNVVPVILAMGAYTFIYFTFALLTIGYYRNIVRAS